jgi:hypothetical protein
MESGGSKAYPFGAEGGKNLAEDSGQLFLGEIPLHPLIGKLLDQGRSLFEVTGQEAVGLQTLFLKLAENVVSECEKVKDEDASLLGSFQLIWKEM